MDIALRPDVRREWYRPTMFGLSVLVLLAGFGLVAVAAYLIVSGQPFAPFDDLRIYQDATRRLFTGGEWYLPHQAEPYTVSHGDVLYPPVTAWFFAPWLILPAWTFVVIPVSIVAWVVASYRPAPWTWPILAACLVFPPTLLYLAYANPGLWIVAFVALGLRYQWPGALVLLKPSMAPFALIGIRSRGWWMTVALLGVASLPFLAETLAYPGVILRAEGGGLLYSLGSYPMTLIPLVAWLTSRSRRPG